MVNLQNRFGKKYRIEWEETQGKGCRKRPEFAQILCRNGHIYVDGNMLGVAVDAGRTGVANKIRQLECVKVTQDGDNGEVNGIFHPRDCKIVFKVMKPRTKRQLSKEHLDKLMAGLTKYKLEKV